MLSGIRTHDGPPFGPLLARPAIVADNRERTWAVVARITHPGIGLSEVPARVRMGNGLSELLEGAATAELVSVVALQIRTVPDDGAERAAWQQANLRADAPQLALAGQRRADAGDDPGRRAARGVRDRRRARSSASPSRPRRPAAASTAAPASCTG